MPFRSQTTKPRPTTTTAIDESLGSRSARSPCSRSSFCDFHIFFKKVRSSACHGRTRCYNPARSRGNAPAVFFRDRQASQDRRDARIAQLVEQRIENPRVGGSNPPPGTIFQRHSHYSCSDARPQHVPRGLCLAALWLTHRSCFLDALSPWLRISIFYFRDIPN